MIITIIITMSTNLIIKACVRLQAILNNKLAPPPQDKASIIAVWASGWIIMIWGRDNITLIGMSIYFCFGVSENW